MILELDRIDKELQNLDCVQQNIAIAHTTYYQLGGNAKIYCEPRSVPELKELLHFFVQNKIPFAVTGTGSNSVFSDADFEGALVSLKNLTSSYWLDKSHLFAQCGVTNTELAEIGLSQGYLDLAWMYRMPGLLGASVRMNARCYGGETSAVVEQVNTLTFDGYFRTYQKSDVFLGYKKTLFMTRPEIIVSCVLKLTKKSDSQTILEMMENCEGDRHKKHHFDFPSCGSTFKNNYEVGKPSGQVFDELGFKGTSLGGCQVSDYHANFIFHKGQGTASEMLGLAQKMRCRALENGINLQLEVQPMGSFPSEMALALDFHKLAPVFQHQAQLDKIASQFKSLSESVTLESTASGYLWPGDLLPWTPLQNQAPEPIHSLTTLPNEPQRTPTQADNQMLPLTLLEGTVHDYFLRDHHGLNDLTVHLKQLNSVRMCLSNPDLPLLEFKGSVPIGKLFEIFNIAPQHQSCFQDELWKASVIEVFFARPAAQPEPDPSRSQSPTVPLYFEFEVSPDGSWVALSFDAPRVRSRGHEKPNPELWQGVEPFSNKNNSDGEVVEFGLKFDLQTLLPILDLSKQKIRAQICVSLGNERYFLLPHWDSNKNSSVSSGNGTQTQRSPNFHQPCLFSLFGLK